MELFKSFNRTQQKIVLFLIASALVSSAILIITHTQREKALDKIKLVHSTKVLPSAFDVFSEGISTEESTVISQEPQDKIIADKTFDAGKTSDKKVNLNTASTEEIESLPRIGPAITKRIIAYRQTHGGFKSIEEIMEVKGIGEKIFEKIKGRITVEEIGR